MDSNFYPIDLSRLLEVMSAPINNVNVKRWQKLKLVKLKVSSNIVHEVPMTLQIHVVLV